jgi:hypothetical protein
MHNTEHPSRPIRSAHPGYSSPPAHVLRDEVIAGRPLHRWLSAWHRRTRDLALVRVSRLTSSLYSFAVLRVLDGGHARLSHGLVADGAPLPPDVAMALATAGGVGLLADGDVDVERVLLTSGPRLLGRSSSAELHEREVELWGRARDRGDVGSEALLALACVDEGDELAAMTLRDSALRDLTTFATMSPRWAQLS